MLNIYSSIKWLAGFFGVIFLAFNLLMAFLAKALPAPTPTLFGILLIFIAYIASKKVFDKSSYVKYLNEKNDGIYTYYAKLGGEEYGMNINTNKRTIEVISGKNKKLLSFDNIKSWRYSVEGISKVNVIGGTHSFVNNASALMQANAINNQAGSKAWSNSGFFIHTDDLTTPVWQIKIIPLGAGTNVKSDKFWKAVVTECQIWMNVMEKVVR